MALALAYAQIVFGAIVRITGSGMGCGDHWPKCLGQWFPPLDRPDLIIEITHRYIALALLISILALIAAAWRRRSEPGVSGSGGVLRTATLAGALWFAPALLGALTVWLELPPLVVVVHKVLALALLAVLAVAVIRAWRQGDTTDTPRASPQTSRSSLAAAAIALLVVVLGAFTANIPGAAPACQGFPLCNGSLIPESGAAHVHMTHRILAFLLTLHVIGLNVSVSRRHEPRAIVWAARASLAVIVLQITIAAVLVETFLPPLLQSLHQAAGTLVWLSLFVLAALARGEGREARTATATAREPRIYADERG